MRKAPKKPFQQKLANHDEITLPYDNNWLGNTITLAVLQEIGEDERWHNLGQCRDTPNAIKGELQKDQYQGKSIWIKTPFGRRFHGLINASKEEQT